MKRTLKTLMLQAVPFLLTLALMLGIFCIAPPPARAAGVDITDRFVDPTFREAIREELGLSANAPIYDTDAARIKVLDIQDIWIESLAGIEYCTGLEELNCNDNRLTVLDVTALSNLRILNCYNNLLTELIVKGLSSLRLLNCHSNQLTRLDASDLPSLRELNCTYNLLAELNISGTANLRILECSYNQLTELDVSGLSGLQMLGCGGNKLTELDVTGMYNLQELACQSNRLVSLDVAGLSSLSALYCGDNRLEDLDLSGLSSLQVLFCHGNQLTELNVSGLTRLNDLYCFENELSTLDVSGLTNLLSFHCNNNKLTELNVSGLVNLYYLRCDNNRLTTLDTTNLTSLQALNCSNNQISELSVAGLSKLHELSCFSNRLTSLDVTGITSYPYVHCQYNYMDSEADVIGFSPDHHSLNFEPQHAPDFIAASDVSGVPYSAEAYTPIPLPSTVFPSNATNQNIIWTVENPGQTGATIEDDIMYTTGSGEAYICAIIYDGFGEGRTFYQYFTIDITMPDNMLPFLDVPENMWYYEYVKTAYNDELVNGKAQWFYFPEDNMTVAEAVKIAACMHQLYYNGNVTLTNAQRPTPWYSSYMDYALQNNIIDADLSDIADTKITRREFVYILYAAIPNSEYAVINNVADNAIPDVKISSDSKYAPRIYAFYRAGILTGSDELGTFNPESNIKRNEVAAVLTRMLHESARQPVTLG